MALTLTEDPDVRSVRIDYTVPALGATLNLSRTGPSGTPAGVRAWAGVPVAPGAIIARDFEAPIGVALVYTAVTKNAGGTVIDTSTATITLTAGGCSDTWLNDLARAANTMQVVLEEIPALEYPVPTTVHEIISRRAPIVSSDIAHVAAFEMNFLTATLDEREQARALLSNGVPVLLRTPPQYGLGNVYFSVLGYSEQRIVTSGIDPNRRWVVSARTVDRPDPVLFAPIGIANYLQIRTTFATYTALKAGRVSYDAMLYDWAGSAASDVVPWPPDDV